MNTPTRNRRGRSSFSSRRTSTQSPARHGKFHGSRPGRTNTHRNSGSGGHRRGGNKKNQSFDPSRFINTNPVDVVQEVYTPKNTFETFGLNAKLVKTITSLGLTSPSPIQDQIIPEIMKGHDVVGLAATGTGKTAAFLIPLIEKTLQERDRQTLILTPTRELAIQINDEFRKLSRDFNLFSTVCVGGVSAYPQVQSLRRNNHFIVGTPGRVLDLINRKKLISRNITTVVLDEADRMLDMGFIGDMRKILSHVPSEREMHLFSATMSNDTKVLIHDFLKKPVAISVKKKDVIDSIEQNVVSHGHHNKFEVLLTLLKKGEFTRVLIFGSMKHSVERLARQLSQNGVRSESIHGNKNHTQRQRALLAFKKGHVRVLVATDVAARGIHVENVSHVINYDLPNTFEDYVHRIGRTGRAEKRGKALTFVSTNR